MADASWRTELKTTTRRRSRGLDASRFHKHHCDDQFVVALKEELATKVYQRAVRQLSLTHKLRRQVFGEFACYHRYGLQKDALEAYEKLIQKQREDTRDAAAHDEAGSQSTAISSSSGSSNGSGVPQPKRRLLEDATLSQHERAQAYRDEFHTQLSSQSAAASQSTADALWSLEPRLWSREKASGGKRAYMVAHLGRFLDHYWRSTDPRTRHAYELIPAHAPCRLYLDIEYSKEFLSNMVYSPEDVLDELWDELVQALQRQFPEQLAARIARTQLVDLDSSTDKKFSRHWILHLPFLFENTRAVGAFVQGWVADLAERQGRGDLARQACPALQQHLFVSNSSSPNGTTTCLVDLGVYTRNRLFRLLGSTKYGKPPSAALRIADANEFDFGGLANKHFYLPAMEQSFQPSSGSGVDPVQLEEAMERFCDQLDWRRHAQALADALVVPVGALFYPLLPYETADGGVDAAEPTSSTMAGGGAVIRPSTRPSLQLKHGTSPYPMVDDFILTTLATRGGVQGSIRAWSVDHDTESGQARYVHYQMSRNRYCENVQRAHRSNNIMWTVDLSAGTCTQGCHDPDCRLSNFRGRTHPLPVSVHEELQEMLLDEALAGVDEAVLLGDKPATSTIVGGSKLAAAPTFLHTLAVAKTSDDDSVLDGDDDFEAALMALQLDEPSNDENTLPSNILDTSLDNKNPLRLSPPRKPALLHNDEDSVDFEPDEDIVRWIHAELAKK